MPIVLTKAINCLVFMTSKISQSLVVYYLVNSKHGSNAVCFRGDLESQDWLPYKKPNQTSVFLEIAALLYI